MCYTGKCPYEGYWGDCESKEGCMCDMDFKIEGEIAMEDIKNEKIIDGKADYIIITARWIDEGDYMYLKAGKKELACIKREYLGSNYEIIRILDISNINITLPIEEAKAYVEMHFIENVKYIRE